MKRLAILIITALLCVSTAGCQKNQPQPQTENSMFSSADESAENKDEEDDIYHILNEVVDKDGNHIGEIKTNGAVTLTNQGIFYTTVTASSHSSDTMTVRTSQKEIITYHLYNPEQNEHYELGSVPDQDYEAGYLRTEINHQLYTLITTGNALDNIPDPLLLLAFDLTSHSLKQYRISDNGFPYSAMTEVDGNLLIMNHDQQKTLYDKLILFDTQSGESRQVLQFELTDNQGDSIRQMHCDGENIYLLRLHFENENNVTMFLDTYDRNFQKLSEKDISSMARESIAKTHVPEDITNEMKQMVNRFIVLDKQYVYYENFSTTRFLGNIQNGELFNEADDWFLASSGSGKPFFCYIFGGNNSVAENAVFSWNNGSLEKSVFTADDKRYYITSISVNPNGKRLIQMEYVNPDNRNDTLSAKLYYL